MYFFVQDNLFNNLHFDACHSSFAKSAFPLYFTVSPHQDPWVGLNWGQDKLTSLNDLKFRDLHRKLVDLRSEFHKLNQNSGGQLVFVSTVFYTEVFYLIFCTWKLKYPLHWAVIECIFTYCWLVSLILQKKLCYGLHTHAVHACILYDWNLHLKGTNKIWANPTFLM